RRGRRRRRRPGGRGGYQHQRRGGQGAAQGGRHARSQEEPVNVPVRYPGSTVPAVTVVSPAGARFRSMPARASATCASSLSRTYAAGAKITISTDRVAAVIAVRNESDVGSPNWQSTSAGT